MVSIASLWMAILLAAALVWIVSSLVWMVLPHHKKDWSALPNEKEVFDAMGEVPPGQYDFPHMASMDELKTPEIQERFEKGPAGFFIVAPRGLPKMGKNLALWFLYAVFVSGGVAYIATRTLPPGTEYLAVFRVTGTVAWMAYGFSHVAEAIWFARPWSGVFKQLLDAFLYGLVTAGAFAWLWPA